MEKKKGFYISPEDLERVKIWMESEEGKRAIKKELEKMKPESEMERWARNHKEAEWWNKIKDIPFTI